MHSIKQRLKLACGLLASLLVGVASLAPAAHADSVNLVPNSSFVTASSTDSTQPSSWFPNSWGTNTPVFTYLNEGRTDTRSVRVNVSGYQDGDAKWLFNAVPVAAGTTYEYADWYRANTSTNLWARFEMNDGTVQYRWLTTEPAATTWAQSAATVTIPANTLRASVFHVLNANGQLDLDDVSLIQEAPCSPTFVNGLPNGGFEQTCSGNANAPAGWQAQTYGPDIATYAYTTDAHSGSHAVSITTTSENDEAGWTATDATPASNQRYQFSFWQKGTTYVYAYVTEALADGTTQDVSLMSAPATGNSWSHYSDAFVTPAGVQSLKFTIATSGQGTIVLDDVVLNSLSDQTPSTFTKGMVSITFDDGSASQYTNALPILTTDSFAATFYLNGDTLGDSGYLSEAQVASLASKGHEIGSHLYHHSDMVQLDTPTIQSELSGNKTDLQQILGSTYPITDFASPYGSYTSGNIDTVMQYESSHRTTDGEFNTKANLDPRQIHGRLVDANTTTAQVQQWLADAKNQHAWLVLVYHGVTTNPATDGAGEEGYAVTPSVFKSQMSAIQASGLSVKPVNAALAALLAQE
ncbi:MAG TPA: polysaccharide deacetylase family protein [Candidatus Saccharimonadales bacterium]|nr:polysaccharide deacetylase family protein [Candidatus Saccharimonadales bacterium]